MFYAIYSCVFPGRLSFYDYYSIFVKNVNDPLGLQIPPSHRKNPGRCQRKTTSAKFPRFARPGPLPKRDYEHKVSPFRKAQAAAKGKPRAQSFPVSQSPGRCQEKIPGKREPSSRWQACGPRRASEGRAVLLPGGERPAPTEPAGENRDVKVLCFFLSRKKRRKKAARRGRLFFQICRFSAHRHPAGLGVQGDHGAAL